MKIWAPAFPNGERRVIFVLFAQNGGGVFVKKQKYCLKALKFQSEFLQICQMRPALQTLKIRAETGVLPISKKWLAVKRGKIGFGLGGRRPGPLDKPEN